MRDNSTTGSLEFWGWAHYFIMVIVPKQVMLDKKKKDAALDLDNVEVEVGLSLSTYTCT